ncbi:MAG: EamA family transporter, partial [Planctomycetia bacterium]|nr:EamA family transporter [Planctomycetia bacterium]
MTDTSRKQQFFGVFLAISAFFLWGLFPLYFCLLQEASSYIILAFRAVTVSIFLVPVICIRHKWSSVLHVLKTPVLLASLCFTAAIICVNWWIFIWMVQNQHTLHASFANYICPLFNVVLGIVFFHERLCTLRKCAVVLGVVAVVVFAWGIGSVPWGSLAAAGSFALYSVGRKLIPVDSVSALSVETIAIAPFGLAYIIYAPGGWCDNAVWV